MHLEKLKREKFSSWKNYYFHYQKSLAEKYYIPRLQSWGAKVSSSWEVLDIGCGDGGFISAFADLGCTCTGVEIRDFNWAASENVTYLIGDINQQPFLEKLNENWDLIILRDVIEHIPQKRKLDFLNSICKIISNNTLLIVTFPPFYSPFGLHQQALFKSFFRFIPYLSWIPRKLMIPLIKFMGDADDLPEIIEIYDSKMTINNFIRLVNELELTIKNQEKYHIRPSHEIRYGLKMIKADWADFPIIREGLISGCTYLIGKR